MTQVRPPLGNTDRYMKRCKHNRENGDGMLSAVLLLLGIAFVISLLTAI